MFARYMALNIKAERRAVAIPILNMSFLPALLFSSANLVMKNFISHMHAMNFMAHSAIPNTCCQSDAGERSPARN